MKNSKGEEGNTRSRSGVVKRERKLKMEKEIKSK